MKYLFDEKAVDAATLLDSTDIVLLQSSPLQNRMEHWDLKKVLKEGLSPYEAYFLGASRLERVKDMLEEVIKSHNKNEYSK